MNKVGIDSFQQNFISSDFQINQIVDINEFKKLSHKSIDLIDRIYLVGLDQKDISAAIEINILTENRTI